MSKVFKIISVIILLFLTALFFIYWAFTLMDIEDRYGDFQEIYYNSKDGDVVLINNREAAIIKFLDGEVYVQQEGCLRHLLNFSKDKIEVYRREVKETATNTDTSKYFELRNDSEAKLIYKNF